MFRLKVVKKVMSWMFSLVVKCVCYAVSVKRFESTPSIFSILLLISKINVSCSCTDKYMQIVFVFWMVWLLTCHQPGWRLWITGICLEKACGSGPHTGREGNVPAPGPAAAHPAHCRWRTGRPEAQPWPSLWSWWRSSLGNDLVEEEKRFKLTQNTEGID